jgi:hypothetical protein
VRSPLFSRARPAVAAVIVAAAALAGCGGGGSGDATSAATSSATVASTSAASWRTATTTARPAPSVTLSPGRSLKLPAARAGTAVATIDGRVIVAGGLSDADVSTDTVFELRPDGRVGSLARLPGAIHDAAAATLGTRVLNFGGGVSEGSDHIVQVLPGSPHRVGTLPQPLSDLVAAAIGGTAYVAGGWNGTATNRTIYAVTSTGRVHRAGALPLGVRYPAAGALDGRLILAGGEMTSGSPTRDAFSFDPRTGAIARLPRLPEPTDHAAGVTWNGRFYSIGGLRRGNLTAAIVSWAPGERRWRTAGTLPVALSDASAVPFGRGVAVLGGRTAGGRAPTIVLLRAR